MPWGDFDTRNDRATPTGPGVCMAMTCHWIRRVFDSADRAGNIQGLDNASQLREFRHHVTNQARFEELSNRDADNFVFKEYGLLGLRSEHRATSKTLLVQIRLRPAGLYLFGALGRGGGHAMGIMYDGRGGWVFFDPNVGQRCFRSEKDFGRHLVLELADYADLRDTFEIYQVFRRLQGG